MFSKLIAILILFSGLMLLIAAGWWGTLHLSKCGENRAAANWPTASGTIIRSELKSRRGSRGRRYSADMAYRFVEPTSGRPVQSRRIMIPSVPGTARLKAERIVRTYPNGAAVTVYYDPADPTNSVLEPGWSWPVAAAVALSFPIFCLGGLLVIAGALRFVRAGPGYIHGMEVIDGPVARLKTRWAPAIIGGLWGMVGAMTVGAVVYLFSPDAGLPGLRGWELLVGIGALASGIGLVGYLWQRKRLADPGAELAVASDAGVILPVNAARGVLKRIGLAETPLEITNCESIGVMRIVASTGRGGNTRFDVFAALRDGVVPGPQLEDVLAAFDIKFDAEPTKAAPDETSGGIRPGRAVLAGFPQKQVALEVASWVAEQARVPLVKGISAAAD